MKFLNRHLEIYDIVRMASRGQIALPAFQRDFVWSPGNVIELIESVGNGWPVGALLLLEGPQPFATKAIDGVNAELRASDAEYFLLDGQQRVTALFHALDDAGDTVYFVDLDLPEEKHDDDGYPLVQWSRRTSSPSVPSERIWTLSQLRDHESDQRYLDMSREQREELSTLVKRVLGELHGGEYQIPAIIMRSDIDLEALTRIFETLNRTGTRLDAFDLMVAIVYNEQVDGEHVDLRAWWNQACSEEEILGAGGTKHLRPKPIEILKLVALWQRRLERDGVYPRPKSRRVTGVRQSDVLNIPGKQVVKLWSSALSSYLEALEWMRGQGGVADGKWVPSWAMILAVADSFDRGANPETRSRWYWRSIALQSYAQGANTQVLADVDRNLVNSSAEVGVREALRTGLGDDARRNRILRLGYRGLIVVKEALDPFSGGKLEPNSMAPFIIAEDGSLRSKVEPTDMVARIVYCNRESLGKMNHSNGIRADRLDAGALVSQGVGMQFDDQSMIESRLDFYCSAAEGAL